MVVFSPTLVIFNFLYTLRQYTLKKRQIVCAFKIIQPHLPLISFFRCLPAPVWSVDEKLVDALPVGRAEIFPALIVVGFVRTHLVSPALKNTNNDNSTVNSKKNLTEFFTHHPSHIALTNRIGLIKVACCTYCLVHHCTRL